MLFRVRLAEISAPYSLKLALVAVAASLLLWVAACTDETFESLACAEDGRVLNFGFYAFFPPVSYSANEDATSEGFGPHQGYEADLLSALEEMEGADLAFSRKPIDVWEDIWLLPATTDYDMVGGGITILNTRTRNAAGDEVIAFTSGHIAFRQSLLVRAQDAERLSSHSSLTSDVRVGALVGTTGEARMLFLTGLTDAAGVLAAGTRTETPRGTIVADGSPDFFITAAGASPSLAGRSRIHPPSESLPQVVYLSVEEGQSALLDALAEGRIDAVARGEIGNRDAAREYGASFTVTALDAEAEYGGFSLAVEDAGLRTCLDEKIDYLTDGGRIGYAEWSQDSMVFMRRAEAWSGGG